MRIGVVGLGRMGTAIAERLLETGHELVVWNRTREKARHVAEMGAALAETPAELVGRVDAVVSILTDAAALEAVYTGEEGLLAGEAEGRLFIEMSTVRPEAQRVLAEAVRGKGGALLECAVSGTTGPARQGRLIGLVGGTAEDLARARPILEQLCRRIEHGGPVGAGASLKLAVNLPLAVYYQALGEAFSLCRHIGFDPARLVDLLSDTSGGPNLLKTRGGVIAKALAGEAPQPVAFDVDSLRKDLRTMIAEGNARGFDLPLAERALAVYDEASRTGWGARDGSSLVGYWSSRTDHEAPAGGDLLTASVGQGKYADDKGGNP